MNTISTEGVEMTIAVVPEFPILAVPIMVLIGLVAIILFLRVRIIGVSE